MLTSCPLLVDTQALDHVQVAWGLSSVFFGRCEFSPRAASGLREQREEEKLVIYLRPLARKHRNSGALFSLRLPSLWQGWVGKKGRQPQSWNLPSPAPGPVDLPLLPRPAYQPPRCHDATAQSHSVSKRNVLEGEDLLGQLRPPAIYGFGVYSEQWPAGHEREGR